MKALGPIVDAEDRYAVVSLIFAEEIAVGEMASSLVCCLSSAMGSLLYLENLPPFSPRKVDSDR